ncbi:phage tail fiber protein [Orbaceae bacterium ESL0721]|nr:phage tail fiber protein [Orbaceae bacterium ESL0721]
MAVTNQQIEFIYTADGATKVFPFYCRVVSAADLFVTVNGERVGGFVIQGLNSDSGGNVVFDVPPLGGATVLILRDVQLERETEYQTNGDFLAKTVNSDFDRIWMALQGTLGWFKRALKYPLGGKHYDAENRRIENLANPINDQDAVTKIYVNEEDEKVKNYVNEAISNSLSNAAVSLDHGYFMFSVNDDGHLILTHNDNEPTPPFEIVNGRLVYRID